MLVHRGYDRFDDKETFDLVDVVPDEPMINAKLRVDEPLFDPQSGVSIELVSVECRETGPVTVYANGEPCAVTG